MAESSKKLVVVGRMGPDLSPAEQVAIDITAFAMGLAADQAKAFKASIARPVPADDFVEL